MSDYKLVANSDTVKNTKTGAIIPNDPANRDRIKFDAWIAVGNTPDPVDPVVITADHVNAFCRSRILSVFSQEDQINAGHEAQVLQRKEYKNDPPLTVEEAERLDYLESAELWKQATLEACRTIKAMEPIPDDFETHPGWPALPTPPA